MSAWIPLGTNKKDLGTLKMLQFSRRIFSLLCTTGEGKTRPETASAHKQQELRSGNKGLDNLKELEHIRKHF